MMGNFSYFCRLLIFLNITFKKNLSGTLSECQTVWDPDQDRRPVGPDICQYCLQITKVAASCSMSILFANAKSYRLQETGSFVPLYAGLW